ncbi:sensor histidine kinase [Kribbella sp. VKM Ac-2568]|uniref:sensor histidine kinase n=1 Tax=Kribbella sp. VKM Ac-2568 TaxID=2512219 RepID=UPI00104FEF35|nr:sensor histidine kinase [Kribbella sp. VKM Ac-2568]TCM45209.1 two-component system sensor histidine kinase DesK [Kribbella sp. VKM Ac-2568]
MTFINQPIPDGPVPGPFGDLRRRAGIGWLFAGVWLVFLSKPLGEILKHREMAERVLGIAALALFALGYLGFFGWARYQNRQGTQLPVVVRIGFLVALLAMTALMIPAAGESSLTTLVYVEALGMMLLPLRAGVFLGLTLLALVEISLRLVPGWHDDGTYGFSIVLGGLAVFGLRRAILRSVELAEARKDFAELAVQEERNRFARDLHDILGHSLTVITVKAELAGRLIPANPDRAAAEVADVEQLARAALADVRAAVAGYRELSLAGELVAARAALQAAEIRADLPTTVDEVPEKNRELFAWVVREGVTNVIRHSGAKRCRIELGKSSIEVIDDGKGPTPSGEMSGHGLIGLRERANQTGATVTVGTAPNGGFRLAVRVDP